MSRRLGRQDGFTIVEVLVAAICLGVIVVAVLTAFVRGNQSSLDAQRHAALVQIADQQIENIRQALKTSSNGFTALALSATPTINAQTVNKTLSYNTNTYTDPNHFVKTQASCGASGLEYAIEANYDNVSGGTDTGNEPQFGGCDGGYEPLIVQTSGTVGIISPSRTVSLENGTETATVDSYVTQTNVGCNASLGSGSCSTDARRVIVAVQYNGVSGQYNTGPNAPLFVSTIFTNPTPSNAPNSSIGITLGLGIG